MVSRCNECVFILSNFFLVNSFFLPTRRRTHTSKFPYPLQSPLGAECQLYTVALFLFWSSKNLPAFAGLFQLSRRMWWFDYFGLFPLHFIINCLVCTLTLATLSTFIGFRAKKAISFLFLCLLPHSMCSSYICSILLILDTFRSNFTSSKEVLGSVATYLSFWNLIPLC